MIDRSMAARRNFFIGLRALVAPAGRVLTPAATRRVAGAGCTYPSPAAGSRFMTGAESKGRQDAAAEAASGLPPLEYHDDYIKKTLAAARTIAMIGASTNANRPSFFAMKYLQAKGYRVIPVNPGAAGKTILGELCYPDLKSIPDSINIDMVDCFRDSKHIPPIAKDAIDIGAKVLWLQLGVRSEEAREMAEAAGLLVVQDRCPKIEFGRLFGELGWHGFNSGVISSKKRAVGSNPHAEKKAEATDSKEDGADKPKPKPPPTFRGFDTRAIHAGASPDPTTGARSTPIFQTTAYVFDDADHAASLFNLQTFGNIYSRLSNPTVSVLEERIANLEGGRGTTCTASGHSAQLLTLFALMQPGDKVVSSNKLYGGSITQLGKTIQKFGWGCEFVDVDDEDAVRKAVSQDNVKCVWAESLANPGGIVTDIRMLSDICREAGIPLIIDNTMATPYLCRPFEHGADIVVHSTTKFLSGHGNAMGGAVVDSGKFNFLGNPKFPSLSQPEPAYHGLTFAETFGDLAFTIYGHAVGLRDLGPTMAPFNAFLTITGIETLALRMERHCENGQKVAEFLNSHPEVAWVSFATLPGNKYGALADKYLNGKGGSVFTFGVKGGYDAGVRVVERVNVFSHLANLGDVRSLILHPASTTHRQLTEEQRVAAGAGDDVLRISVGIESAEDLIADLDYALSPDP